MNVWKEKCMKNLAEGRFDKIRSSFAYDVSSCENMEQLIDIARDWVYDLEDIMEELNGGSFD